MDGVIESKMAGACSIGSLLGPSSSGSFRQVLQAIAPPLMHVIVLLATIQRHSRIGLSINLESGRCQKIRQHPTPVLTWSLRRLTDYTF